MSSHARPHHRPTITRSPDRRQVSVDLQDQSIDPLDEHWPDPLADDGDPQEHPAIMEPYNKEEWYRYIHYTEPPRPTRLPVRDYEALSNADRAAYNRARDRFHSALVIVETPGLLEFQTRLKDLLSVNAEARAGARAGLFLSGPSRVGKSTTVKVVTRRYERYLRKLHPEYFTRRGDPFVPVAYLLMPGTVTIKTMMKTLGDYYNQRTSRLNGPDAADQVAKAIRRCGTQILVIDDVHFLDPSDRYGRDASTLLKQLANISPATFVYSGIDLESGKLCRDAQHAGRNTLCSLAPYTIGTPDGEFAWIQLVRAMENSVVLLRHQSGDLVDHWKYLYERTGGSIWSLGVIVRLAAHRARVSGDERITETLLRAVEPDMAAVQHRQAERQRAKAAARLAQIKSF